MTDRRILPIPPAQRELWLTPSVQHFLTRYGGTESAKQLSEDIIRALDGRDARDGCIRLTALSFLLFIIDAVHPEGHERVIVWHGPSDGGTFFNDSILHKAVPCGADLM